MKIIDLLVRINNDEEIPKKIRYEHEIFTFDNKTYVSEDGEDLFCDSYNWFNDMNIEVEIIEEEKKIEKIIISMDDTSMPYVTNNKYQKLSYSDVDLLFASKINELIDVINDMRDKEC